MCDREEEERERERERERYVVACFELAMRDGGCEPSPHTVYSFPGGWRHGDGDE